MSERFPHKQAFESFERALESNGDTKEAIQFGDSNTALLMRTKGDILSWNRQKHAKPNYDFNCTIIAMSDGSRVAVGAGAMVFLPELDSESGRFEGDHKPADYGIIGLELSEAAPDGLPDVVIGKGWPTESSKTVESVMIRYKPYDNNHSGFHQVDLPFSPLESAQRLVQLKRNELTPPLNLTATTHGSGIGRISITGYTAPPALSEALTKPIPGRELRK